MMRNHLSEIFPAVFKEEQADERTEVERKLDGKEKLDLGRKDLRYVVEVRRQRPIQRLPAGQIKAEGGRDDVVESIIQVFPKLNELRALARFIQVNEKEAKCEQRNGVHENVG